MKPATPLPWIAPHGAIAHILPSETQAERSRSYVADFIGNAEDRRANCAYAVHAANAYPKLLAVTERLRAALRANGAPNCEAMKEAAALLAELGES